MGTELRSTSPGAFYIAVPAISWLDTATASSVVDITQSLAQQHPEVQAVILLGSVARREERPLSDARPSDVDILLLLDASAIEPGAARLSHQHELALHATIGEADYRHRGPRAINVVFLYCDLAGWDSAFIKNVARDGLLLWAQGPLPGALSPIEQRGMPPTLTGRQR